MKNWIKQKDLPNYRKNKPNFVFKADLDPEELEFIKKLKKNREMSQWVSKAIRFYYDYQTYRKGFLVRLIEEQFALCKHIVRQVGSKFKIKLKKEELLHSDNSK